MIEWARSEEERVALALLAVLGQAAEVPELTDRHAKESQAELVLFYLSVTIAKEQ